MSDNFEYLSGKIVIFETFHGWGDEILRESLLLFRIS